MKKLIKESGIREINKLANRYPKSGNLFSPRFGWCYYGNCHEKIS